MSDDEAEARMIAALSGIPIKVEKTGRIIIGQSFVDQFFNAFVLQQSSFKGSFLWPWEGNGTAHRIARVTTWKKALAVVKTYDPNREWNLLE